MSNQDFQKEIFSSKVRAGRRTYFFDVKETKAGDYYLTITESKKISNPDDETFHFKKHKIYLYKEDFEEFKNALAESTSFIINKKGNEVISDRHLKDYHKGDDDTTKKDAPLDDFKFEDI